MPEFTINTSLIDPQVMRWVHIQSIQHDDTSFNVASTTASKTIYSLPAGGIIHCVKIKHSEAFTGGAISAYTMSVGITGTPAKYASAFNVLQAVGSGTFQVSNVLGSEDHLSATDILLTATSTGANLNAATTGVVDVWILVSTAV